MEKDAILDGESQALLLHHDRWRLVTSLFPPEETAVRDAAHRRWMHEHSHAHPHGEALFVLSGSGLHGFGEDIFPVSPGTVLLFAPMQVHDIGYRASSGGARHLWLSLLPDHVLVNLVHHRKSRRSTYTPVWHYVLSREAVGLDTRVLTAPGDADERADVARARVTGALGLLASAVVMAAREERPVSRGRSLQEEVVRAIERHIRETAGRGVSLESVARIAGYSKCHFHRVFKSHTGMTLHQYVDACRRDRVSELKALGLSQRAISESLGFSHPAAYSRWRRNQS